MENVFVALVGNTPQVVTESLYYYTQIENLAISRIILITTSVGEEQIEKHLLANGKGAFYRFCKDYGISPAKMALEPLQVLQTRDGRELEDIRTVDDNIEAANYICRLIKRLCNEADTRLLCSMAGGRKTLSAYMALAMQYFARDQDRLSHVLIQPEALENHSAFFYPPPDKNQTIRFTKHGTRYEIPAQSIRIDLAEIHFVRLRKHLHTLFTGQNLSWEEMVYASQGLIDKLYKPPELILNVKKRTVEFISESGKYRIRFPHKLATVYHFLLSASPQERLLDSQEKLQELYTTLYKIGIDVGNRIFGRKDLLEIVSNINRRLANHISDVGILHYCKISTQKIDGKTYHKIPLTDFHELIKIHS